MTIRAIAIAATVLLMGCDEAREEYAYTLPEPAPTMPPPPTPAPAAPAQNRGPAHNSSSTQPQSGGLPGAQPVDWSAFAGGAGADWRTETAAGIAMKVPASWENVTKGAPMRAAEFKIPGKDGGPEGELIVFHFGTGQGGDAQANATRWLRQIVPDAESIPAEMLTGSSNGLKITAVVAEGTYTATAMGPAAPKPEPRDGWALFGIIVEGGPQGSIFLRFTGPRALVRDSVESLKAVAANMRAAG